MAILKIPYNDNPDSIFTIILDNVAYDIRLQWNTRDESWNMYLGRQSQPPIFKTKLATDVDLLKSHRALPDVPKGMMMVVDLNKSVGRITRDGFSSGRFGIYYADAERYEQYLTNYTSNTSLSIPVVRCLNDNRFTTTPA